MSGTEVVAAVAVLLAFAMGIPVGVVLVVSLASLVEDGRKSIWGMAPNAMCLGVRRLIGAGVRGGQPFRGFAGRGSDDPAHGQEPKR